MTVVQIDPRVHWGVTIQREQPVDGPNERCIELPLAVDVVDPFQPGAVLDAGSALNGVIQQFPLTASVLHLTQHIGSEQLVAEQPVSFVSGDIRRMSLFADHAFDRTVCISTLEHVGLDNETYGGPVERCPRTVSTAVKELCRVTRDLLLITVPYAEPPIENGQWRFLGQREIGYIVRVLSDFGFTVEMRHYMKCEGGWYGGGLCPWPASDDGFPQSVNAIACLRGVR